MSLKQHQELAQNLVLLSKQFVSTDPAQAADIKRSFKEQSKNDCVRTIVYLLEVIGRRDTEFKKLQAENKDLQELLKVNNIELDAPATETSAAAPEAAQVGA